MMGKKRDPRGLIFDCDGTLADTNAAALAGVARGDRAHRLHLPEERF